MVMEIRHINLTTQLNNNQRVACIGYFDGLHLGHQQLIQETLRVAKEKGCIASLITFDPDPWITIGKIKSAAHITPLPQRLVLAQYFGLDEVLILDFSQDIAGLNIDDFELLLLNQGIKSLIVGFDFSYGAKGKGNVETLKANNRFDLHVVTAYKDALGKVSSTRIDQALLDGNIDLANQLLGYPFFVQGTVIHGKQVGRELGFPTANVQVADDQLLPSNGVYAAKVYVNGKYYQSMINIGHNPTCNYVRNLSLEAHIFDFNESIYDQPISLVFYHKIRNEIKFKRKEQLIDQLCNDKLAIKVYFNGK